MSGFVSYCCLAAGREAHVPHTSHNTTTTCSSAPRPGQERGGKLKCSEISYSHVFLSTLLCSWLALCQTNIQYFSPAWKEIKGSPLIQANIGLKIL